MHIISGMAPADHLDSSDHPTRMVRPPNDRLNQWLPLIVFFVVVTGLVVRNFDNITDPRFEDGDFAANSILIDEATELRLDHGNYSRFSFYHPGPAFLYVQGASEVLMHDLTGVLPTPFNAHQFGVIVLNAALLALAAGVLARRIESGFAAVAVTFGALVSTVVLPGALASTWMPYLYVWPFLLFLVSAASVSSGRGGDLWKFVLAGGLLVHGHIAFVLFVLVGSAVVATAWGLAYRREWLAAIPRKSLVASLVLLAVFVAPIAIHTARNFPGQMDDYLDVSATNSAVANSITQVVRFTVQYWGAEGWAGLAIAVVGGAFAVVAALRSPRSVRGFALALVATMALATLLTMIYAYLGADDLSLEYLAAFSIAVPILALTIVLTAVARTLTGLGGPTAVAAIGVVSLITAVVLGMQPSVANGYTASAPVRDAFVAVDEVAGARTIVLTFANDWDHTVGIVQQARREGRRVCVDRRDEVLRFLFTEDVICTDLEAASGSSFVVLRAGEDVPATIDIIFNSGWFIVARS